MKKPQLITLISLGILATVMFLTNPSQEDYIDYAANRFFKETKEAICNKSSNNNPLENLFSNLCRGALDLAGSGIRKDVEDYLTTSTKKTNYVLFTIYATKFLDQEFKTLGIFGNFITFSR